MNEYYVRFQNGGFAYVYADSHAEQGNDIIFIKDGKVVERYPKVDVRSIEKNPAFGENAALT